MQEPMALLAAVIMMMLGYVVGGLALFGGSVLAAAIAVAFVGMSGIRHLRKLLSGDSFRVVRLDGSQYTDVSEPQGSDSTNLVQLDRSAPVSPEALMCPGNPGHIRASGNPRAVHSA